MKLLLDTDIGCDMDDMLALAYLLAKPDADLLGITTVGGEVVERAKLADLMCRLADKQIPVHPGADEALDGTPHGRMSRGEKALLNDFPCIQSVTENSAVDFLRKTIEEHPHEITLCSIGMPTNIAMLFKKYPHIIPLLDRFVIMAGRFGDLDVTAWGEKEYNIRCDIQAAKIVFEAPLKEVWVFGVEQTCRVYRKDVNIVADNAEKCKWLMPFAKVIRTRDSAWYHDAVAVASLFWQAGMTFEQGTISVTENGDTLFSQKRDGNVHLLRKLDVPMFLNHYCDTVKIPCFPSFEAGS